MNKVEMVHNERKEHWRALIAECDSSGMTQQEWCYLHQVCAGSMSKWRRTIWREEEAEKELGACQEENSFVDITAELAEASTAVKKASPKSTYNSRKATQTAPETCSGEMPRLMTPDAVIGYRDYMVGVYEHTSNRVLQKVMEVLRYA